MRGPLIRMICLTALVVFLKLFFCGTSVFSQEVVDKIVAVVNGEVITLFELNQRFRPVLEQLQGRTPSDEEKRMLMDNKRQLLDRMIEEILLRQEAERLNMTVSDMELQTHLRQSRERIGMTEAQFNEQLILQGMDRASYERRMREEILRHRLLGFMIRRKVVIASDEIREYYESKQHEFAQQRQVHLGLILFENQTQAEDVHKRLLANDISFAEAARQYSQGPGADQGGDIGLLAWRDLAADWRSALESLGEGDLSVIFYVQNRPALLKVLAEERGETKPLVEVEDQIREALMEPRLEARYDEYMSGLRNRALIDIRL